jgi:hypothetical protein
MRFQCQAAVGSQVSLGAEAVRRLHHRDHDGGPDRTDPWNQAQQFPRLVLLGFQQQISACFLAQGAQGIQLLAVLFGAPPRARFADLREPGRTVPWGIHFFAGTRNAPTAIQDLQPIRKPCSP